MAAFGLYQSHLRLRRTELLLRLLLVLLLVLGWHPNERHKPSAAAAPPHTVPLKTNALTFATHSPS